MSMNHKIMGLAAALWVLGMAAGAGVAPAGAQTGPAKIAVVNVERVMQNAAAAKSARAQVAKMRASLQQEIKRRVGKITKSYKKLKKTRPKFSKDLYQELLGELRKEAVADQNMVQDRHRKLDGALSRASDKIAVAIEQVVSGIIKERKLALVLPRSGIIGRPGVPDITAEVLKRLDRRLPSITVELPK